MIAYLIRRLLYTVPIVFGVCLIIFALFNLVGGDPTYQMLGKHASPTQIVELRHELGLDKSAPLQFVDFLKQVVTFDFGRSYATKQRISEMIWDGMPASLSLAIPAFLVETFLGIVIALLVSYFRGSLFDRIIVVLCVMGMSISSLAYILFGQYVLAYWLGWFPISGYDKDILARFQYVALPALIWVAVSLGINVRVFRTFMLDEVNQDYVRTARAKGLSEKLVLFKHVLKNAMIPVLTYVVIEIPFLITGSFLLESFFGIPGLGSITIDAIHNSDFPVIKAMTVIETLLFIFGNLLTDMLYSVVDPRVRLK
ncbi:MAG: ABC transporter permease [Candidatus Rokubacteria bacterium]|nr:ABC transporter permease [Candidatus Rokubacteria bacterium]